MSDEIKRGNIYWIETNPYRPSVGSVQVAGRPGIIVSNDLNNENSLTYEIVYLTTTPKKDIPTHCIIHSSDTKSTALCEQITTISSEQIGRYIGSCTKQEMASIDACIAISLGLNIASNPSKNENNTKTDLSAQMHLVDLEKQLIKAQSSEAELRRMYNELLERVLSR